MCSDRSTSTRLITLWLTECTCTRCAHIEASSAQFSDERDWWTVDEHLPLSAETVLGFERQPQRNQWYHEDCRGAENVGLSRTIERGEELTDALLDARRESRKGVSVRKSRCRNDARKFHQEAERLNENCKPRASSCKNGNGNLVTDPQGYWSCVGNTSILCCKAMRHQYRR